MKLLKNLSKYVTNVAWVNQIKVGYLKLFKNMYVILFLKMNVNIVRY